MDNLEQGGNRYINNSHLHFAPWKEGHHKNRNNVQKEYMEELNSYSGPKSSCINEVFSKMHQDFKPSNFDPYACDHKIGGMSEF